MIVAENNKPTLEEFRQLMKKTDSLLNSEAVGRDAYYAKRNSTLLEQDVYDALCRSAAHTPFEGSISLVSGSSFPDIIANRFYGVEVKSTIKNQWKSIGSSILESTRDANVERIFLTFGKLGAPVSFMSRPYEECLSGISVTHYPRYQIDMNLPQGETIFDKMGISYDELRNLKNPVAPVSKYYKSKLNPGESLWWASDDVEETAAPPILRLWTSLSAEQKNHYTVQGYALFPEILSYHSATKYQRYALWLATSCGIINTNIRDQFSAGGKVTIITDHATYEKIPAAFGRIYKTRDLIVETIMDSSEQILCDNWNVSHTGTDRIHLWCKLAASYSENIQQTYDMLCDIFGIELNP